MANEAVCIELPKTIKRYTVADTAFPKGSLLKVADPNTASLATGTGEAFAGITVEEKVVSDGILEIACAIDGVFDILATAPAITCGAIVVMSGANTIRAAVAGDLLTGAVVGKALETGSAGSEVIRVRLGVI